MLPVFFITNNSVMNFLQVTHSKLEGNFHYDKFPEVEFLNQRVYMFHNFTHKLNKLPYRHNGMQPLKRMS